MAEKTSVDGNDLEPKIVEVMSKHPNGLSHEILKESLASVDNVLVVNILNKLLAQHKIQLLTRGNKIVYKLNNAGSTKQYQGPDIEEKIIFEALGRAGNNGINVQSLKSQCNLAPGRINKILKTLETKRLIKSVTSTKSRKKLYLLYELEPSQNITGGTFYSGEEFEAEYVDVLADHSYRYLTQAKAVAEKLSDPISQRNGSFKSLKDICEYINSTELSKVKLSLKDVEKILESLVYDDKVEKSISMSKTHSSKDSGTDILYRVNKPLISSAGIMMVPCGVCPVYRDCHIGGDVSPATCVYLKNWLDF